MIMVIEMIKTRKIVKVLKSKPTIEGSGVHLKRVLSHRLVMVAEHI